MPLTGASRRVKGLSLLGVAMAAACLWGWPANNARAGVDNTHHDIAHLTGREERGVCSFCHLPHGAFSQKGLFARQGAEQTRLGDIGAFCYSCHDGTVVPTALVEAPDGTIGIDALTRSHGYTVKNIESKTGGVETAQNIHASGLVPIDPVTNSVSEVFDCSACHDPHTDKYAPFLRQPLEELCQKCHSGRDLLGKGRWTTIDDMGEANGPHPIRAKLADSGRDRTRGGGPEQRFHSPDGVFDAATPTAAALGSPDVHWDMGGHLVGADRMVSCVTCHSAHMPGEGLLLANAAKEPEKVVCAGCHTDGVNLANPGMTPFYHPVFEESLPPYVHDHAAHPNATEYPTTGTFELFVQIPPEFPLGTDGGLLCRSCHVSHDGRAGEKCLREGPAGAKLICHECHREGRELDREDMHHPIGSADYTKFGFSTETSWSWGKGLPGDLTDGLQCTDCHSELAKSAHNWD